MSINLTDLLDENPTNPWCPACQGDGYLTHVGGPGYFCPNFGNYLPSERDEPCDDCHGSGRADDGSSPLSRARQHLKSLTLSQRLHLERLHKGQRLPTSASTYGALEDLYGELEDELDPRHPALADLDRALENAELVLDHPEPAHQPDQRTSAY